MKIATSDKWTYERLVNELPNERFYEIRNYQLIEMSSPKPRHQTILSNFYDELKKFVKAQKNGKVFFAPTDVILSEGVVCIPDILFISNENKDIIKENAIFGSPDLIVEVVSKGSVARDYVEKKNDYEKYGVKEYWIIDPRNESVWVYCLENSKYELHMVVEEAETLKSKILDGFEIQYSVIFQEE